MKYNLNDIVEFYTYCLGSKKYVKGKIIAITGGYGVELLEEFIKDYDDKNFTFIIGKD